MSFRLPPTSTEPERSDSECTSSDDGEEETWDDWVSESGSKPCRSLFDEKTFPSAPDAISYDKSTHGFDLERLSKELGLDFHQRARLINYIRKENVPPLEASKFNGKEAFFQDDAYLKPVLEDDKLLEYDGGEWTDSDNENNLENLNLDDPNTSQKQLRDLANKLALSNRALDEYREMMGTYLGSAGEIRAAREEGTSRTSKPARDDDTHYFNSYSENEIHSVMIQDTVRTSTYASFILSNPEIFENAVVLDVGCGTGVLSLFAASAGASHVYAIDASEIAHKAEQIVRDNNMQDKITVIRGKVEEIKLPVEKVDIIISEWMGYALLYESMLDSVLHARDRFLKPGGLIAPTESRMQIALCDAADVRKGKISFWEDVYGFDMSAMSTEVYNDAIIDVVAPESLLSNACPIKTINACNITPKQLDFSTPFKLTSTTSRKTKAFSFLLYFDIIFNTTPETVDPEFKVQVARPGEGKLAEVWPLGRGRGSIRRRASTRSSVPPKEGEEGQNSKTNQEEPKTPLNPGVGKVTSFTTGPMSIPTHWKQTVFLLREPISLVEGTVVEGTFHCRKSSDNSRELDVEIHYTTRNPDDEGLGTSESVVQIFKVQ